MSRIKVLTSDSYTDYSYQVIPTKFWYELNIYNSSILRHRSSEDSDPITLPQHLESHLPNFSKYSDITSLKNFPQLCKIVLTESFSTSFSSLSSLHTKINSSRDPEDTYPIAVRYISSSGGYYIERPPFQIEVNFNRSRSTSSNNFPPLKIWIPWTISYYHPRDYTTFYIYFSNKSLSSSEDKYLPSFLPNAYDDGRICFGQSSKSIPTDYDSIKNIKIMYQAMFNEYMSGGWNTDLNPKHVSFTSTVLDTLADKEKYPTLHLFCYPTFDYFRKHYPKMRASTINSMIKQGSYSGSYYKDFKYFFFMMNTFDLETTMKFYSEIIQLSTIRKHNFQSTAFPSTFEEIQFRHSCRDYNHPSNIFSNVTPALTKFLLQEDPFVDLLPSSPTRYLYFIYNYKNAPVNTPNVEHPLFFNNKLLHKLIAQAVDDTEVKKIYYINSNRTDIEKIESIHPFTKFRSYYLNLLRDLNSIPVSLE